MGPGRAKKSACSERGSGPGRAKKSVLLVGPTSFTSAVEARLDMTSRRHLTRIMPTSTWVLLAAKSWWRKKQNEQSWKNLFSWFPIRLDLFVQSKKLDRDLKICL